MTEREYITNKDAIALIKKRVMAEPLTDKNLELIRFIVNTISKVVAT